MEEEIKTQAVKSIIGYFYFMYMFICMISIYVLAISVDHWLKPFPIGGITIPACFIPFGILFFMSGMMLFEYKTKKITKLFT